MDGVEEAAEVEGLGDEVDFGAEAGGLVEAELAGDEDDFDLGEFVAEIDGEGVSGESGEADVEEGDVGAEGVEGHFGFFGAPDGHDFVAEAAEEVGEGFAGDAIIFDQ